MSVSALDCSDEQLPIRLYLAQRVQRSDYYWPTAAVAHSCRKPTFGMHGGVSSGWLRTQRGIHPFGQEPSVEVVSIPPPCRECRDLLTDSGKPNEHHRGVCRSNVSALPTTLEEVASASKWPSGRFYAGARQPAVPHVAEVNEERVEIFPGPGGVLRRSGACAAHKGDDLCIACCSGMVHILVFLAHSRLHRSRRPIFYRVRAVSSRSTVLNKTQSTLTPQGYSHRRSRGLGRVWAEDDIEGADPGIKCLVHVFGLVHVFALVTERPCDARRCKN